MGRFGQAPPYLYILDLLDQKMAHGMHSLRLPVFCGTKPRFLILCSSLRTLWRQPSSRSHFLPLSEVHA